ncbi:hypothetical protein BMS3Bbin15_01750 [archaeon BMS3Bbin15]|nr:hypothetical protein BMS3Bbin15_01750 [archaeon BMS3Bbin15]
MVGFLAPVYDIMTAAFGWLFYLTPDKNLNYMLGVFIIATAISIFITVITGKVVDQKKMKSTKEKMKGYQERVKKAQKDGNTKEMNRLNKEMLSLQGDMFSNSFKPMIFTMVPILLIFSWLRYYVPSDINIVELPFFLPIWGNKLGWFGWYFITSIAVSPLVKKILNLEM